jgi:hypothetical protein
MRSKSRRCRPHPTPTTPSRSTGIAATGCNSARLCLWLHAQLVPRTGSTRAHWHGHPRPRRWRSMCLHIPCARACGMQGPSLPVRRRGSGIGVVGSRRYHATGMPLPRHCSLSALARAAGGFTVSAPWASNERLGCECGVRPGPSLGHRQTVVRTRTGPVGTQAASGRLLNLRPLAAWVGCRRRRPHLKWGRAWRRAWCGVGDPVVLGAAG